MHAARSSGPSEQKSLEVTSVRIISISHLRMMNLSVSGLIPRRMGGGKGEAGAVIES